VHNPDLISFAIQNLELQEEIDELVQQLEEYKSMPPPLTSVTPALIAPLTELKPHEVQENSQLLELIQEKDKELMMLRQSAQHMTQEIVTLKDSALRLDQERRKSILAEQMKSIEEAREVTLLQREVESKEEHIMRLSAEVSSIREQMEMQQEASSYRMDELQATVSQYQAQVTIDDSTVLMMLR
jgi:Ni,Fe-hydrogenase I large subunit